MSFTIGSFTSCPGGDVQVSGTLEIVQLRTSSGTRLADIQGSVGDAAANTTITKTTYAVALFHDRRFSYPCCRFEIDFRSAPSAFARLFVLMSSARDSTISRVMSRIYSSTPTNLAALLA